MIGTTNDNYVHEMGFYHSDSEFADLILPFAESGRRRGEPVIFAYDRYKTDLLKHWLGDSSAYTYITDSSPYATPARALREWRTLALERLRDGAARVRIAGNVPHPGYGVPYAGWDRYEAALDRCLGDLPVWAPCLYDTRITPPEILDRAVSLHHSLRERDRTLLNAHHRAPTRLTDFLAADPDPMQHTAPTIELDDPSPALARTAIRRLPIGRLTSDSIDALVLATSEAVTNAIRHGVPPVRMRVWVTDDRTLVHVTDSGRGPADPLTGLLSLGDSTGTSGRGLWMAHQMDLGVTMTVHDDGFTIGLGIRAH